MSNHLEKLKQELEAWESLNVTIIPPREIKMDEEMRNHFLGHSMGSNAGSGYGDAHGLSQFYDELLKIDWSFITRKPQTKNN